MDAGLFGLRSVRHPIVTLLGTLPLWGGGITTPISILYNLRHYIIQAHPTENMQVT